MKKTNLLLEVDNTTETEEQKIAREQARAKALQEKLDKEEKERKGALASYYQSWKNDKTLINKFIKSKQVLLSEESVIVEAFLYIPSESTNKTGVSLIGDNNFMSGFGVLSLYQQANIATLPFVKVIHSTLDTVKTGEIYSVSDKVGTVEYNEDYTNWWSQRAQQPSLENTTPMPPKFRMGWGAWAQMQYKLDKFDTAPKTYDNLIFKIPEKFLVTKSNL